LSLANFSARLGIARPPDRGPVVTEAIPERLQILPVIDLHDPTTTLPGVAFTVTSLVTKSLSSITVRCPRSPSKWANLVLMNGRSPDKAERIDHHEQQDHEQHSPEHTTDHGSELVDDPFEKGT